jgi:O-antigen/teichoic acid export membrane protein
MAVDNVPKPGLGVTVTRGVFWTGGGQILRQLVQITSSVLLARLLVPDDFGLLGMVLVFVGVGQLFADFGIGSAIVQSQTTSRLVLSSCFWANLAVGVGLALLLSLAAPLVAWFYDRPEAGPLVVVAAIGLVLSAAMVVPRSSLYRDMRFAEIAQAQFFGSLLGALAAIACAWSGFGVWSLLIQPLAGTTVTLLLSMYFSRWMPRLEFSWPGIRGLIRFSAGVLGSDLLSYANRNTDSLIIGRGLGGVQLGYYSMAYQLMLYPLQQVSGVIVRVLFPTLSQLQGDMARFRDAYLKSISSIALVTFPMMIGLFAVADDFVQVVLGVKWLPMLSVLRILVWVGMIQSVATTVGTLYLSTGNVRQMFYMSLASTPILLAGIGIGLNWGIEGVAAGYAIATFSLFYVSLTVAFRLAGLRIADFHRAVARPLAASLCMLVAIVMLQGALIGLESTVRLGLLIAFGIVVYGAASLVINRTQVRDIMRLARGAVART